MKVKTPFGYEYVNGKLVVNEQEKEILQYIHEKTIEYHENPPHEVVCEVLSRYKDSKNKPTYEEAQDIVRHTMITELVTKEVNEKYGDYISSNLTIADRFNSATSIIKVNINGKSTPIINEDTWNDINQRRIKSQTM